MPTAARNNANYGHMVTATHATSSSPQLGCKHALPDHGRLICACPPDRCIIAPIAALMVADSM
jgi:hypothetical protein